MFILGCKYKALYSMLVDGIWRFYFSQQAISRTLSSATCRSVGTGNVTKFSEKYAVVIFAAIQRFSYPENEDIIFLRSVSHPLKPPFFREWLTYTNI
jgi:hypothetical protein